MVTDIGPSTVEAVAVRDSTRYPFQRKGFYAKGYHFEFYYASSKIYLRRSTDGITWESANDITPSGETPTEGAEIAVWLDRHEEPAHHPYIVYADHDGDSPLYFRRGTIDDTGALTWDAGWQTAVAEIVGVSFRNLTICVDDTNGYPFIGYTHTIRADPPSDSKPRVTHSQQMDGTWSTFSGFPEILNTTNDESWVCVVVPYNGVYVMAVYVRDSNEFKYDIYNVTGDSWAGEVAAGVVIGADATKMSVTSQRAGRVVAQDPRRVHIAFCYTDENLNHISIDDGGVTGPTLIYSSATAMGPSISTRIYGGDALDPRENPFRTLYVFWSPFNQDEPAADIVCYKKSIDAGANWTKEDGSVGVEQWANETGDGLSGTNIMSSYFEEQPHFKVTGGISLPESYIGVIYTNQGASPDYVRFAGLEFADPDEDLLCNATIKNIGAEQLFAKFEAQAIQDLLAKFEAQTTANLLAKINITHSADLLGKFEAQVTADLLGKAEIGQNSADLNASLEVGQDSTDAYAHLIVRNVSSADAYAHLIVRNISSADAYAHFIVRNISSAEAYAHLIITNVSSADAYAHLIVKNIGSAEAYAHAIVRNIGSANAYAHFNVRQSDYVDLGASFRTSTDDWLIQGVSIEAYIAKGIIG